MSLSHIRNSNNFQCFHPRIIIKDSDKVHYLNWNKKVKGWQCTCWWYANRTAPNLDRWGYCTDVLALLLRYDKKRFYKEIQRTIYEEVKQWEEEK